MSSLSSRRKEKPGKAVSSARTAPSGKKGGGPILTREEDPGPPPVPSRRSKITIGEREGVASRYLCDGSGCVIPTGLRVDHLANGGPRKLLS